ncbi:hypothetical protein B0H14DRAFT_1161205 [Mycena olivaceomarginata]|nr:hypothetical protein B0H14DRAFT_1161205 [Mycena olivaceomarginata]
MALFTGIGLASPTTVSDLFGTLSPSAPASSSSSAVASSSSSTSASITLPSSNSASHTPTRTQSTSAFSTSSGTAEAATVGASFFHNKPVVIGVFAGGAVLLLLLASFITCLVRRSSRRRRRARQQQLDREMDASFRETVQRTRAAEEWRGIDPRGASSGNAPRKDGVSSEASGSHGMYYTQPLPLPPQQQPAFYAYDRDPAPAPAYREEWERETPAVMGLAVRGVVAAPQIVQPPARAQVQGQPRYGNSNNLQSAAPSVEVGGIYPGLQPNPSRSQRCTCRTTPYRPSPRSLTRRPSRVRRRCPLRRRPLPNPFDQQQPQQQQQGHLLRTPSTMSTRTAVSPISPLPNPYGGMED